MLRRYPDAEATMGEARLVGETGPDAAGKNLMPTTVKVSDSLCMCCTVVFLLRFCSSDLQLNVTSFLLSIHLD